MNKFERSLNDEMYDLNAINILMNIPSLLYILIIFVFLTRNAHTINQDLLVHQR